ncbi:unnamed protein product [Phytophthora fragariaefolia]|uniref:Unnamed protein product n=1 Tax=Phytophthora fragariaefolia TaxID=1490495 RepID=A0A9W6Y1L8_9STRA|nr:unnamed protein product [Phytophthora fragariaefolia]
MEPHEPPDATSRLVVLQSGSWIKSHMVEGGKDSASMEELLPQLAVDRWNEVVILRLACKKKVHPVEMPLLKMLASFMKKALLSNV